MELDAIYREHHREVARFVRTRLGHTCEVADVCQEIWEAVFHGLSRLADQGALRSWLFAIARHKMADARRHHGGLEALDSELGEAGMLAARFGVHAPPTPSQALARQRRAAALQTALAGLRPDDRELIELHFLVGLKPREIARMLDRGIAANTVAQRIVRATRRLRDELAQEDACGDRSAGARARQAASQSSRARSCG